MAFSSLSSNQMVSEGEAATTSFALKSGQTQGSGNLCMTKLAALTKYNLNTIPLTNYANNQLIPKSVWSGYALPLFGYYNTKADACSDGPLRNHFNVWMNTPTPIVGTRIFLNSTLTTVATGYSVGFYHREDTGEIITANVSGYITSIEVCSAPEPSYAHLVNFMGNQSTAQLSCTANPVEMSPLYSADSVLVLGSTLYTTSSLTTPFNGLGNYWLFIANDTNKYAKIHTAGVIQDIGNCVLPDTTPPTTPSLNGVADFGGGFLRLSWTVSTDNIGVNYYHVYREENSSGISAVIAQTNNETYDDYDVSNGNLYSYKIKAVDTSFNESGFSNTQNLFY